MKQARAFLQVLVGVALVGALAVGLMVVFGGMSARGQAGTVATVEATGQPYPPPQTMTIGPTMVPQSTPIVLQPGENIFPSPTLPPTHPPLPTPTRRPEPVTTPLPLPQPARDAAGTIQYFTEENGGLVVYMLTTDPLGQPQGAPVRMPSDIGIPADRIRLYPAPDGRRWAIVVRPEGEGPSHVNILYTETGQIVPLFKQGVNPLGLFFAWHPDGRHVLLTAVEGYYDTGLWLVNTDSEEHIRLLGDYRSDRAGYLGDIYSGVISPDGQKIVYANSNAELWMINPDGTDHQLLLTGTTALQLTWSPNGSSIAFLGGEGLMFMNMNDLQPQFLSNNHDGLNARLVWSPDSTLLAFNAVERQDSDNDGAFDIFTYTVHLVDVTVNEERLLLVGNSGDSNNPTWSPDGSQIAFTSTRSGSSEIWVVNMDGSNLRQLTNTGLPVRFISWHQP